MSDMEKRVEPRAAADFVVELYAPDGGTLVGIAKLLNLSVQGACVESITFMDEKDAVMVRLLLGKRHLLTLPAVVMWAQPGVHQRTYGLKFGEYSSSGQALVTKFVDEYFEKQRDIDFLAKPK